MKEFLADGTDAAGLTSGIFSFHLRIVVTNSFLTGIDPAPNYRFYSSIMTACMYSLSMYALHVYVVALVAQVVVVVIVS